MKNVPLVTIAVLLAFVLLAPGMLRLQAYLSLGLFTLAVAVVVVKNNKVLDRMQMKHKAAISIALTLVAVLMM